MIIYVLALTPIAIACYSFFINRVKGLPPGPPPLPLIGNFYQFDVDMDKKFVEWKKKYGKVFTIWMPYPAIVISDNELLQTHIVKDGEKFGDRINPKVIMQCLVGGEYGLVLNDNSMWREQRRFALHSLRNAGFNNVTVQNTAIEYADEIVAHWKQEGADKQPVDLTMGIMTGVANIIWQQTFSRTLPYDDPLFERVNELMKESSKYGSPSLHFTHPLTGQMDERVWEMKRRRRYYPKIISTMSHPVVLCLELFPSIRHFDKLFGSPIKKLAIANDGLLEILRKELEIVEQEFNGDEIPKSFAEAFIGEMKRRETKGEELGTFTHQQLVVACYDLWTAGFETTVTTLRFIIHYMVNNREVQRKAQAEIDEKVGKRNIQMEDQKSLHYCNATIQEVQPLANIIAMSFTKMVSAPVKIEGYDIPVGTGVIPEFNIVHMDEKEFERPEYFCPERHINENGEFVKDTRITPFSLGKRSCLGEGLARMELFLYFTSFIQHLTFSSVTKIPPVLDVQISFTRSPAPFKVLVESRD